MVVDYKSYNTNEGRGNLYFSYIKAVDYAKQSFVSVFKQGKCQSRIQYETRNVFKKDNQRSL